MKENAIQVFIQNFIEKGLDEQEIEKYKEYLSVEAKGVISPKTNSKSILVKGKGEYEGVSFSLSQTSAFNRKLEGLKYDISLKFNLRKFEKSNKTSSKISGGINIDNCDFTSLHIEESVESDRFGILISECNIGNIQFTGINGNIKAIHLLNCVFNHCGGIFCFVGEIHLSNCTGSFGYGQSYEGPGISKIKITRGTYKYINIHNHSQGPIEIENVVCDSPIILDGHINYKIQKSPLLSLIITGSMSSLNVNNFDIGELSFKNTVHQDKSIFTNVSANSFKMEGMVNSGNLTFYDLKHIEVPNKSENNDFIIKDTNLGKTFFVNSDFSEYDSVNIEGSDLTEIKSIATKWPKKLNQNNAESRRETYRQLKLLMANSHDKVNELHFHYKEMEAYLDLLNENDGKIADRINLWISKESNDFGENYLKPIGYFFLFGFWCYLFVLLISDYPPSYIINRPDNFIEFLNPVHKFNFIENLHPWSSVLDFVGRIISSFFIYQTITAFRRLYKK
ncbi:hypothetical protein WJR50_18895 [Catalinimonas sp. 4WD22]|uniref:hypothetical protein n=1 Tax=Catalinimonas locisalis TaxID=3133978 RepID=UPI003100C5AE